MDPVSAMVVALGTVAYAAITAAGSQAKTETHMAAEAILEDLRQRREAWAEDLKARLENGRSGGPFTALWWGWAAFRTAQALRAALSREPREAEREEQPEAERDEEIGSFGRIWGAAKRGAQHAREENHRRRANNEPPKRVRIAICWRCGHAFAEPALQWAPGSFGLPELLCINCRTPEPQGSPSAGSKAAPDPEDNNVPDDVVDADLVDATRELNRARPEIEARPATPAEEPPTPPATPTQPTISAPPKPPLPPTPVPPVNQTPVRTIEGEKLAPRNAGVIAAARRPAITAGRTGGALVRAGSRPMARGRGGASYTHGQWTRVVADIEKRLDEIPGALEAMMRRLTAADAGRSQVVGVVQWRNDVRAFMAEVRAMLTEVDRREQPVLKAVELAGGPEEIAGIPYLSEV